MQGDWRLVNGAELYNLAADPGQRSDIADQHPERVTRLRAAYEEWWELCTRNAPKTCPISIGAAAQDVAELRTHDLRNEDSDVVWNQDQIRAGQACNGYWEVFIEQAGAYQFSLRRWPAEAGHELRAGLEGDDVPFRRDAINPADWRTYTGGAALAITGARLEIEGAPAQHVTIDETASAAIFRLQLAAGPGALRAAFITESGAQLAPYYVSAQRLST